MDNIINTFSIACFFDVCIFCAGLFILFHYGRISFSHPATIYLVSHFFGFTYRAIAVLNGAPTLFSLFGFRYSPITYDELTMALIIADCAFALMLIGWLRAAKHDYRKNGELPERGVSNLYQNLSRKNVYRIFYFAFPIGLIGFFLFIRMPGRLTTNEELAVSGWVTMTRLWPILLLLALVYINGFKAKYMVPIAFFLSIMFIQGGARFRVVLPVLFLAMIYLDQHHKKWPPVWMILFLISLMLVFPSMKIIGRSLLGTGFSDPIVPAIMNKMNQWILGEAGDQHLLDSLACTLSLVDFHGEFYYGRKWLYAIFIMWIPRVLWPGKPNMGGFLYDISVPSRPMGSMGMVSTYIGDAYGQFWYPGVAVVSYLLAYWMGRAYFKAYRSSYFSIARFAYLVFASTLIQVYRDGIKSFITFGIAVMMPLFLIIAMHWIFGPKNSIISKPRILRRPFTKR